MTQVEACPFCAVIPQHTHVYGEEAAEHPQNTCVLRGRVFPLAKWNTRTPSPATGSAVPASTVTPSPVGEGQAQPFAFYDKDDNRFWMAADNCRDYLSAHPEVTELYTRQQMDALAAQAPKPASAGGEPAGMWAIYKRNDEAGEWCHAILWHNDTVLDNDERYVFGYFTPADPKDATPRPSPYCEGCDGLLAAQAPKPASGGGERYKRLWDIAVDCDYLDRESIRQIEAIAAEADTAK